MKGKDRFLNILLGVVLAVLAVLNFTGVWAFEFTIFEVVGIGSALTGAVLAVLAAVFLLIGIFGGKKPSSGKSHKWVKWVVIAVAFVLLFVLLTKQEEESKDRMAELSGTYSVTLPDTAENAMALLERINAYEEEIALADLDALEEVQTVWFGAQGGYTFGYDVEATQACVRSFYKEYFSDLYAGRATLNEVYEADLSDMSDTAFYQYVAELYGKESMEVLLDYLVEIAYDYNELKVPYETGTYRIEDGKIYLTVTGEDEETYITYELEGDALTLGYSNEEVTYTKIK